MDQRLQLVFLTDSNKSYTINIDTPKVPYNAVAVKACMDACILNNVIITKNGPVTSIKGANLVTKTVEEVTLQ